jgi:hypothetical protein
MPTSGYPKSKYSSPYSPTSIIFREDKTVETILHNSRLSSATDDDEPAAEWAVPNGEGGEEAQAKAESNGGEIQDEKAFLYYPR